MNRHPLRVGSGGITGLVNPARLIVGVAHGLSFQCRLDLPRPSVDTMLAYLYRGVNKKKGGNQISEPPGYLPSVMRVCGLGR